MFKCTTAVILNYNRNTELQREVYFEHTVVGKSQIKIIEAMYG